MTDDDHNDAPPALDEENAATSTELPVVVFADDEVARRSAEVPRVRLLPGRIHPSLLLYPIYVLVLGAGLIAARFAVTTAEWSAVVVLLAWFVLYLWTWFYSIAYRYRRRLLKYTSVLAIVGLTASLTYFSIERAAPQQAMLAAESYGARDAASSLYFVAFANVLTLGILLSHLVFFGRGYREKK